MFWDTEDALDPIAELLSKENLSIVDVYNEGKMLQELRTNNKELLAYFAKEQVVLDLCRWSMTMEFSEQEFFDKYSRISTEILTCKSQVANGFMNSAALKGFFNSQLCLETDWDPMCAGHFQRVFLHLMVQSDGSYLSNFQDIIPHLMHHISTLAVTEFISTMTIDYYNSFCPNGEMIQAISDYLLEEGSDSLSAVYALRQIFSLGWENPNIQRDLSADALIANMIAASKTAQTRLAQIELLRLLNSISKKNELALIFRRGDIGNIPSANCSCSALASEVQGIDIDRSVSGLISPCPHWTIVQTYLHYVQVCSADELFEAVKKYNVIETITAKTPEELTPFQLEFARIIGKRAEEIGFDISALEAVSKRADKLYSTYGGDLPIGGQNIQKINAE